MTDVVKKFREICEEKGYEELTHPVVYEGYDFRTHDAGWSKASSYPIRFSNAGIQATFESLVNKDYFSFVIILLSAFNREFKLFGASPYLWRYIMSKGHYPDEFNVWNANTKYYFPFALDDVSGDGQLREKVGWLRKNLEYYDRFSNSSSRIKFPFSQYLNVAADFLHANFTEFPPKIVERKERFGGWVVA